MARNNPFEKALEGGAPAFGGGFPGDEGETPSPSKKGGKKGGFAKALKNARKKSKKKGK